MSRKQGLFMLAAISGALVFAAANSDFTLIASNTINENPQLAEVNNIALKTKILKKTIKNKTKSSTLSSAMANHSSIERLRLRVDKTDLQNSVLQEHDNFKRYPPGNSAIKPEQEDPIAQRYDVDERTTMNDDGTMGLTIWSDEKYYLAGDQVQIFAYMQDAEGVKVDGNFSAMFLSDNKDTLGELKLTDKDKDHLYQASFELNTKNLSPGIYKVLIEEGNSQIKDALTFTLSQPDIALTGEFRDKITGSGDLLIEAQVNIASSNKFYVQASLYSATQVPVGVTQFTQTLDSGKHWVELNFAGLMIKDAQEAGPYVLQKVSLAKVTMPMQRAPVEKPDYQTDSYALDEFSSNSYKK